MGQSSFATHQEKLEKALMCTQSTLQLLDDAKAPADIGAYLDLAICRLQDQLSQSAGAEAINRIPARRVQRPTQR